MRRNRYILPVLVAMLVATCLGVGCLSMGPQTIEPTQLRGPYLAEVYQAGRLAKTVAVAQGSPDEQAIAAWLASHREGWTRSFVTYAPGRLVRGDGFNLNLHSGGLCVLNYSLGTDPQQVFRRVNAADAEALVAATGGE